MTNDAYSLLGLPDPRLADHALSGQPAWLWSSDGSRLLWANPAGAAVFGATSARTLVASPLEPADPHRRQVVQLASAITNTTPRLQRLHGFGAPLGGLMTCACSRLELAGSGSRILIVALEPHGAAMAPEEQLKRLVEGNPAPVAAFAADGAIAAVSDAAAAALAHFQNLAQIDPSDARAAALQNGAAKIAGATGEMRLLRIGQGNHRALLAVLTADFSPPDAGEAVKPAAEIPSEPASSVPAQTTTEPESERPAAPSADEISAASDIAEEIRLVAQRHPLRFLWQISADGRFSLGYDEFSRLTGFATTAAFGRPWGEINAEFDLDPDGRVAEAIATQDTWSGIVIQWPVDGSALRLAVELSAIPVFDRDQRFAGYRGFGVCHDLEGLARLSGIRRQDAVRADEEPQLGRRGGDALQRQRRRLQAAVTSNLPTAPLMSPNVVQLRPANDAGTSPALTPGENSAFNELARRLSACLEGDDTRPEPDATLPEADAEPAAVATAAPETPAQSAKISERADIAADLATIADSIGDGVLLFDHEGRINACNRSAAELFGEDAATLAQQTLYDLVAPESHQIIRDGIAGLIATAEAGLVDGGHRATGRARGSQTFPMSIALGRTCAYGDRFYAVLRDLSAIRQSEKDLAHARLQTERAISAKADALTWISHEVRAPVNAIAGFADVMIGERFGPLGSDRYIACLRDIRAASDRVLATINDIRDLARIETGQFDLTFENQNLNAIVEKCIAAIQPNANRARIIIRSSLAPALPPVAADASALEQIATNLISNSLNLANAGGQVIVSTALTDNGTVALRVRDTGHSLNDNELAAAVAPFRTISRSGDAAAESTGINLTLTKALIEANRAALTVKSAPNTGTLIEVIFGVPAEIAS